MSLLDGDYARLFGPGKLVIDTLSNLVVGGSGSWMVDQRFRAPIAGRLASLRTYFPDGSGYAAGTGGTLRVRVVPDDGSADHLPDLSATPVATGSYTPRLQGGKHATSRWNDLVTLSAQSDLAAGKLYHVVWDNVDPAPQSNYISVNYVATLARNGRPGRWLNPADWGALEGTSKGASPNWKDLTAHDDGKHYHAPLLQLNLSDGTNFGNSDMEASNGADTEWVVRNDTPVRERFNLSQSRSFSGLSFATSSSVAGSLSWELKDGDQVLASGQVSEASPSLVRTGELGTAKWFDVALPAPVTMAAGKDYDLVFTAQGTSAWHFYVERNGSDYGFSAPAATTESQAQHLYNGKWIDSYMWNHSQASHGSNWRVVLHQAP